MIKAYVITDATRRDLDKYAKEQVPYATKLALDNTAFDARDMYVKGDMPRLLHRPTPFTQRSTFIKKAKKSWLVAEVGFREWAGKGTPAAKYLQPLYTGGSRRQKGTERLLAAKGHIKNGQFVIPAKPFRNVYGNVKKGYTQKMLAAMRANTNVGFNANSRRGVSNNYQQFFVMPERLRGLFGPHIYMRKGTGRMRLFAWVVDSVHYSETLDYNKLMTKHATQVYERHFVNALNYALLTAR
jgi:hypothetical protein